VLLLLQQLLSNFAAAHGYTHDTLVYKKIQLDTTQKKKNTKSATSSKLGDHTIPPQKSKPTKAQSNAKPKTFLLLKKEEVRCKGSSSYIYKQYYWTPQEAEAVVLNY
jgi:hypothetical protein